MRVYRWFDSSDATCPADGWPIYADNKKAAHEGACSMRPGVAIEVWGDDELRNVRTVEREAANVRQWLDLVRAAIDEDFDYAIVARRLAAARRCIETLEAWFRIDDDRAVPEVIDV